MRTRYNLVLGIILILVLVQGCSFFGVPSKLGSISLSMDLSALSQGATGSSVATSTVPVLTRVSVEVSRSGFATQNLDLTVINNQATGQVDSLEPGYWHVLVRVFSGENLLATGEADVKVNAGVASNCVILLDQETNAPTTGGISLTVGINPLPGYRVINQAVTDVHVDSENAVMYVYEASKPAISVYHADTLVRQRDIALPQAPQSIAYAPDGKRAVLGYPSGKVYLLDLDTGMLNLVGDLLMVPHSTLFFGDKYVWAIDGRDSKVLDLTTGQITSTHSTWYNTASLVLNPYAAPTTAYFHTSGVSPASLHRVRLNAQTGEIITVAKHPYHGTYALGTPIRVINKGSRVATSSGTVFTAADSDTADLLYAGNLGFSYHDLISDDNMERLYALANVTPAKLLIVGQEDFFIKNSVEIRGTPKRVFFTQNSVLVLVDYQGRTYAKAWPKADLGI